MITSAHIMKNKSELWGWAATGFFLEIMVVGNLMLLNIFLAILLNEDEDLHSASQLIEEGREEKVRRDASTVRAAYKSH